VGLGFDNRMKRPGRTPGARKRNDRTSHDVFRQFGRRNEEGPALSREALLRLQILAPRPGLEPETYGLTACNRGRRTCDMPNMA
jgi:hypothetical protein